MGSPRFCGHHPRGDDASPRRSTWSSGSAARREFSEEFKARTVELIESSGKSIAEICRELDLTETAVRRWLKQARINQRTAPGLTSDERAELARLRRENRVLREERQILKKAAAFFAT